MLVRPFGRLGARYAVSKKGRQAYILSLISASLSILSVASAGLIHINRPGMVSWPIVSAIVIFFIFMTIRFTALTVEHGEIVRDKS